MKEAVGPLRLCGEGSLAEALCAVVLVRVEEPQFHLGLRRRDAAHEPPLHLAWHRGLLAQALAEVIQQDGRLLPAAVKALATLSTWPPPLDALAPFLRALASGDLPALPPSLPPGVAW